jgi:hypothetical protein
MINDLQNFPMRFCTVKQPIAKSVTGNIGENRWGSGFLRWIVVKEFGVD